MPNRLGWGAALLLALVPGAALAQRVAAPAERSRAPAPRAAPLLLPEVLASARDHAPQVVEALARKRGAQARQLSAEAPFDTVFTASGDARLSGYYDGRGIETRVTQPIEKWGGQVYGGYRVSGGEFPVYEDERYTNQLGELKVGAVFALLRDRLIDERRFGRVLAETDVAIADAEAGMVAIGVQARTIQAYNNWVFAGLRLGVYRDLLRLAEARQVGFRRQVETGSRPLILLTENEQNMLRRRTLVVQSEQALDVAATALSLYLRDASGMPVIPARERLPEAPPPVASAVPPPGMAGRRPDVRSLDIRLRQASDRLALDRNALLPRLDLKAEVSNDFGDPGFGGPSRNGVESKVGLAFTLPLQQSAARGRIAQTRAEIDAFKARRQFLEDQIAADVAGLGIAVAGTGRLVGIAADEADRAAAMAVAERRRFALGASDFFLVNVREEAAADARVRTLDAIFRQAVANADLAAATGDLTALGL